MKKDCALCFDAMGPGAQMVVCSAKEHVLCLECAEKTLRLYAKTPGRINEDYFDANTMPCAGDTDCDGRMAYSELAAACKGAQAARYVSRIVHDAAHMSLCRRSAQHRRQNAVESLQYQRSVAGLCEYIDEWCIQASCPVCNMAVKDWDACSTIKCRVCSEKFCGTCLVAPKKCSAHPNEPQWVKDFDKINEPHVNALLDRLIRHCTDVGVGAANSKRALEYFSERIRKVYPEIDLEKLDEKIARHTMSPMALVRKKVYRVVWLDFYEMCWDLLERMFSLGEFAHSSPYESTFAYVVDMGAGLFLVCMHFCIRLAFVVLFVHCFMPISPTYRASYTKSIAGFEDQVSDRLAAVEERVISMDIHELQSDHPTSVDRSPGYLHTPDPLYDPNAYELALYDMATAPNYEPVENFVPFDYPVSQCIGPSWQRHLKQRVFSGDKVKAWVISMKLWMLSLHLSNRNAQIAFTITHVIDDLLNHAGSLRTKDMITTEHVSDDVFTRKFCTGDAAPDMRTMRAACAFYGDHALCDAMIDASRRSQDAQRAHE